MLELSSSEIMSPQKAGTQGMEVAQQPTAGWAMTRRSKKAASSCGRGHDAGNEDKAGASA